MEAAIARIQWASRVKHYRKVQAAARARQPNGTPKTAFRPRERSFAA